MVKHLPAWWIVALLGLSAGSASAQVRMAPPRLPGESPRAGQRLLAAQQLAAQGQFAEAIDEYQRLIAEAGDDLLPLDGKESGLLVPVRRICHQRLAALPAAALRLYRARVDPQAEKLLEEGRRQRAARPLERIVEEMFCSRATDQALDLLGNLAFERGDFQAAEAYWSMLTPRPAGLHYPDSRLDPALVRAKQLLARWCRGLPREAELAEFRQQHGQAEGYLAGRTGRLADILGELARRIEPAPVLDDTSWPTFAGSPSRQRILSAAPRCRWLDQPWRAPIDGAVALSPGQVRTPTQAAQALLYHPIIVHERVWLADGQGVAVHDLWTGRRVARWDAAEELDNGGVDAAQAVSQGVRYTLTAADGRVFVRLGEPAYGQHLRRTQRGDSYLVCLDPPVGESKPAVRWRVKLDRAEEELAGFEGSPVVVDGGVCIAWSRYSQGRKLMGIDCYDADSGSRQWRQEISEARDTVEPPTHRQQVLTVAGGRLAICTHAGAVVTLDPRTGRRAWAFRYPRRGYVTADGLPTPRDLAPPIYEGGRLFVAPADSDRIWCLDADSGKVIWESRPVEVVHLLGVGKDRLIFTTGTTPRSMRALVASTGEDLRDWLVPDDGHSELPGLGRGLLAGDKLFWPTVHGWRILRQEDGRPSRDDFVPLAGMPAGNLAAANGCLVIATDRELIGYVPPAHFLDAARKQARAEPASAAAQVRWALAEADAGHPATALVALDHAGKLMDGSALERSRYHVLRELSAGDLDAALERFPTPGPLHLQLLALRAAQRERSEPRQAIADWQGILADPRLRQGTLFDDIPQPAGWQAQRRIAALCRKHGAELYDDFERQARESQRPLDELATTFPNAATTRQLLRQAAIEAERVGDDGRVVKLRRRLAVGSDDSEDLAALARAYERLGHRSAARGVWLRLRHQHGEFDGEPMPRLSESLEVRWQATLAGERLLALSSDAACFVRGDWLICRSAATGEPRWSRQLEGPITWLARHADTLLTAGPRQLAYLQADDGTVLWQLSAGPAGFADFHLEAGRFLVRYGEDRLLALDAETGGCAWHAEIPGRAYHAGMTWVAVPGSRWQTFDRVSGQPGPPFDDPADHFQWIGPRRAVSADRRQVRLHDFISGKVIWTARLERPVSLTGETPLIVAAEDAVLLLVARNQGAEVVRIDPGTGRPAWTIPVWHGRQAMGRAQVACDGPRLFLAVDREMQARSSTSGKPLWTATLPGAGPWQVGVSRSLVLAWPARAWPSLEPVRTFCRMLRTDPTAVLPHAGPAGLGAALAGVATRTLAEQAPSRFAVLAFDPVTGRLVRQLDFAGRGTRAQVDLADGIAVVSTSDRAWALR